jgi:ProP effector
MSRRWHQDIDAILELLSERFRNCFFMFQQRRVPLKIGIADDIIAALGDAIDRKLLGQALHVYTNNLHYRMAQKQGAPRIDLDGNEVGTVSEADALSAAKEVILRKTALRAAHTPAQAVSKLMRAPASALPPPPPEPPQPSKRAGLADLRAAAQRRKAVEVGGDQTLDHVDARPVPSA